MAAETEAAGVMRTAKLVQRLCQHLSPESDESEPWMPILNRFARPSCLASVES